MLSRNAGRIAEELKNKYCSGIEDITECYNNGIQRDDKPIV